MKIYIIDISKDKQKINCFWIKSKSKSINLIKKSDVFLPGLPFPPLTLRAAPVAFAKFKTKKTTSYAQK